MSNVLISKCFSVAYNLILRILERLGCKLESLPSMELSCGEGPELRYQKRKRIESATIPYGWTLGSETSRDAVLALFKTASARLIYDGNEPVWDPILELLRLPLCYQPAIAKVLSENRWQQAQNPKGYVASAASRMALAMCLPDFTDHEFRRVESYRHTGDQIHDDENDVSVCLCGWVPAPRSHRGPPRSNPRRSKARFGHWS